MGLFITLAIVAGGLVPVQTSVNSRLRVDVNEPFLSSGISFLVGTIFLILFSLVTGSSPLISWQDLATLPWWGYLGGLLATICLTANIFLFGELGSVLAIVLPMVGQIIFSSFIDNFGWFGAKSIPMTIMKGIGILLVLLGIFFIIVLPSLGKKTRSSNHSKRKIFWEIAGVVSGIIYACELAINGYVGIAVKSPIYAAFLTFIISTILLFAFVGFRGHLRNLTLIREKHTPWWAFMGGIIGGFSIYLGALLIPQIGTGAAITLGILGQITVSLIIDTFGLLGGQKRPTSWMQLVGLLILIGGVVMTEVL